jgi:hypothetical protein
MAEETHDPRSAAQGIAQSLGGAPLLGTTPILFSLLQSARFKRRCAQSPLATEARIALTRLNSFKRSSVLPSLDVGA